jgi:protoheme IX farnesyltransferase
LLALCSIAAPLTHLTTASFALSSLPVNLPFIYLSYRFYQKPDAKTSRNLFHYSLVYLPLIMILMAISQGDVKNREIDKIPATELPGSKIGLL